MATKNLHPPVGHFREFLSYVPDSGLFLWIKKPCNRTQLGWAGKIDSNGYRSLRLHGNIYSCSRLAWLFCHGEWPAQFIDHIDGDPLNNRISNLRDVARAINQQNIRKQPQGGSSGILGAARARNGWVARIKVGDRRFNLGTFRTPGEAHAAYVAAKRRFHPGCTI